MNADFILYKKKNDSYLTPIIILIVYYWMIIATPQIRFEVLGTLHLERILVFFAVLFLGINKKITFPQSTVEKFLLAFFAWMFICYLFSPYKGTVGAQYWIENYWKLVLLFFLVIWAVNTKKELDVFLIGIGVVYFLYMLHSWYDFLNGGSYVYQQGIKRIIGVWSGGGVGAANAFGMLGLLATPFAIFFLSMSKGKRSFRILAVLFLLLCCLSIIFSGTRGALLGLFAYLGLVYGKKNKKYILGFIILIAIVFMFLPASLKHRYLDQIAPDESTIHNRTDEIAMKSGESRLEGLKDGWKMGLKRPVVGYGPGTSAIARKEVREYGGDSFEDKETLQLHNLYGQVISETGFIGTLIFCILNYLSLSRLYKDDRKNTLIYRQLAISITIILIIYGVFGHTLYRYYWILTFSIQVVISKLLLNNAFARQESS